MPLQVALVSPERILFEGEAEMVTCRTSDGEIAFLTGHAPFLGSLGIGTVKIVRPDRSEERAAVHGGFVEVRNNRCTVLSDVAELARDIDVTRAEQARASAERRLMAGDDIEGEAALRRAHVRLQVARGD